MADDTIAKALYFIIGIYITFKIVQALVAADASFASTGWSLFGALVAGAVLFFREKLFSQKRK